MGGGMALLFNEKGSPISIFDVEQKMVDSVLDKAEKEPNVNRSQIKGFIDMKQFVASFPSNQPRIFVFSLPHGKTTDGVIDELESLVSKGDVLIDAGNEWWEDTERRQARTSSDSFGNGPVHYVGTGVSGGYQAARHGPSMSPGGTKEAYAKVEHLLQAWACKDNKGTPCVEYMGKGGAGHHVKCLHNGIEQGILSAVCEIYTLMRHSMGMSNDEIADTFQEWDTYGGLRHNFLVELAAEIPHFKKGDAIKDTAGIVDDIEDKVTQDADDSEATGVWSIRESARRHVAAPTIAAAHNLRIISSTRGERLQIVEAMSLPQPSTFGAPDSSKAASIDKKEFLEALRLSLYGATLACFVQGCNIIAKANKDQGWGIQMAKCIQIWRAGCIIQSDAISDMLQPIYESQPDLMNLLLADKVSQELRQTYPHLKQVVLKATDIDAVVPALSATLEYFKAVGGKHLPTNFEEAELDYFGHHNYDTRQESKLDPKKGAHHTEWKPA